MKRRFHTGLTLAALALHLIAPVGAYAAVRPAALASDYCASAPRATQLRSDAAVLAQTQGAESNSGAPAPAHGGHVHAHCASCLGVAVLAAMPGGTPAFFVRPASPFAAPAEATRIGIGSAAALLPPLRGPPSILRI